jgi:hypothetical protein
VTPFFYHERRLADEKPPVNAVLPKTFIGDILKARYSYGRKNQAGTAYDDKGQEDSPGSHRTDPQTHFRQGHQAERKDSQLYQTI